MNESKQDKRPTWRRHLDQGVASVVIAASAGLAGCGKTPQEELHETAFEAAETCKVVPVTKDQRGRKRNTTMVGSVSVSMPCEMANDKAAIEHHVAKAAAACANPGPQQTTIYQNGYFIASCTRAPTPEVPLISALTPSASASSPKKEKPVKVEKRNPSFADRAASAPADTQSAQR